MKIKEIEQLEWSQELRAAFRESPPESGLRDLYANCIWSIALLLQLSFQLRCAGWQKAKQNCNIASYPLKLGSFPRHTLHAHLAATLWMLLSALVTTRIAQSSLLTTPHNNTPSLV